jgi:hypothetical protein
VVVLAGSVVVVVVIVAGGSEVTVVEFAGSVTVDVTVHVIVVGASMVVT